MSRERIQLDSELDAAWAAAEDSLERRMVHGRGIKIENEYSLAVTHSLFARTPKSVFAAIAVSFIVNHLDSDFSHIDTELLKEWQALYEAGVVPQKPPEMKHE